MSFTGITLAVGVATWIFSPIKFQTDMGILLTFMFLWNMVGALCLIPALASMLLPKAVGSQQQSTGVLATKSDQETSSIDDDRRPACLAIPVK